MIEDNGRAQFRSAHLEAHILKREATRIPRIETISGYRAQFEILAEDLRNVAPSPFLSCATAAEGQMHIAEGNVFKDRIVDCIEHDRRVAFSGPTADAQRSFGKLVRRIRSNVAVYVA